MARGVIGRWALGVEIVPDAALPDPIALADQRWSQFRAQMPVCRHWVYLDHAAVAPLSAPAQQALETWSRSVAEQGDTVWPDWSRRVEQVRGLAAQLIHAHADEIALVGNTTQGLGLVAEGLAWQPGDNVVFPADEFPSNYFPWVNLRSRGVQLRPVPPTDGVVSAAALAEACDARTRLVAASWVHYASGYRHDLAELCQRVQRQGAWLVVDAIQGLGVFPLDVRQIPLDFLAADGHKWLLGPEGAGMAYIRRERLEQLRVQAPGWHSVEQAGDFTNLELRWKPSAARFEGGSQNMPGLVSLGASLELLLSLGAEAIGQRLIAWTDEACRRIAGQGGQIASPRGVHNGWNVSSGIVSFDLPGHDPRQVRRKLLERQIVVSCRAGRLRISPHAYNNADDLERLISALAEVQRAGS